MTEILSRNQYKLMQDYCVRRRQLISMLNAYVDVMNSCIEANKNFNVLFMAYNCLKSLLDGNLQQTMFYWKKFKDDCNTQMDELLFAKENETEYYEMVNGVNTVINGHSEVCRRFGEFMKKETTNIHRVIKEFMMFDMYMTIKHWVKHIPTKGETFSFKYGGELD